MAEVGCGMWDVGCGGGSRETGAGREGDNLVRFRIISFASRILSQLLMNGS